MAFQEVPLDMLEVDKINDFDLYIKVEGKYRLFADKHMVFSEEHRNRLVLGGVESLFARIQDLDELKAFTSKHLFRVLEDRRIPPEVKASSIYSSSITGMKAIFEDPNAELIGDMRLSLKKMFGFVLNDQRVISKILSITEHDESPYTHSVNVCIYATILAHQLLAEEAEEEYIKDLSFGFLFHDIGKYRIPKEIQNKPGKLTEAEWEIIKKHPKWGYDMLLETGHITSEAAVIVLNHHERHDGSGYPLGISGDDIPQAAKICAIADAFDALTSKRPYRPAKTPFDALRIMFKEMSHEFDPEFFKTFILLFAPRE